MSCVVLACWGKWPSSRTLAEANIKPDRSHSRNLTTHMQKPNQRSGMYGALARQAISERRATRDAVEPMSCWKYCHGKGLEPRKDWICWAGWLGCSSQNGTNIKLDVTMPLAEISTLAAAYNVLWCRYTQRWRGNRPDEQDHGARRIPWHKHMSFCGHGVAPD
jgi:hypothetical protein